MGLGVTVKEGVQNLCMSRIDQIREMTRDLARRLEELEELQAKGDFEDAPQIKEEIKRIQTQLDAVEEELRSIEQAYENQIDLLAPPTFLDKLDEHRLHFNFLDEAAENDSHWLWFGCAIITFLVISGIVYYF